MPAVYDNVVKAARLTATRDAVANGTLEILTSGDALLSTHGLSASGGTVLDNVWTLVLDANTVQATGAGVAAKAQIKNSGGTARITGLTVGLDGSGADIELINTNLTVGQDVELTTATITHAA